MSEESNTDEIEKKENETEELIPFNKFLEEFPLNTVQKVGDYYQPREDGSPYKLAPQLRLWCSGENCQGYRRFDGRWKSGYDIGIKDLSRDFLIYTCRDCGVREKNFCIASWASDNEGNGNALKIGEFPELHVDLPPYLPALLGEEYPYFIKGLKSEKQGCGIGAFSYYRRVVENQKGRFLKHIIKVAKRLNASDEDINELEKASQVIESEVIEGLEKASEEIQFTRAVELFKDFIPKTLYLDGQNPMTVLHRALSIGLHASDDETCLKIAHDIRIILQDFSQRIKDILRDDTEVKKALSGVMKFNQEN